MKFPFIEKFSGARLLVVGEVGIDEYIWGSTHRISPEAPVPVIEVESQSQKLGLAANVAQNISSLKGKVTLVSVRGEDEDGKRVADMVRSAGIDEVHFLSDASRPTLRKVRIIAQRQHVVRVDYERNHGLDARLAKSFTEMICDLLSTVDGVVLQDYGKGLWNSDTMTFVKIAKEKKKPVFVDPARVSPLSLYQGVTLLTPNMVEAEILCGLPLERAGRGFQESKLNELAKKILAATAAEHAIITCGEHGMVALTRGETELQKIPTFARDVFDVTGAGDTVIAILSLMMSMGVGLKKSMQVANAAAGIVVGRMGTSSVSPEELRKELERLASLGLIDN